MRKLGIRELQSYNESVRTLTNVKEMVFGILLGTDPGQARQDKLHQQMMSLQFQQAVAMGNLQEYTLMTTTDRKDVHTKDQLLDILHNPELTENQRIRMFLLYALAVQGDFDAKVRTLISDSPLGVDYKTKWSLCQNVCTANWNPSLPCNAVPAPRTIADHCLLHNPVLKEVPCVRVEWGWLSVCAR